MGDDKRKYDYVKDTENGKLLQSLGWTQAEVLQAGWYALMSRSEQNDKQKAIMKLAKTDPRFKGVLEQAKAQISKKRSA